MKKITITQDTMGREATPDDLLSFFRFLGERLAPIEIDVRPTGATEFENFSAEEIVDLERTLGDLLLAWCARGYVFADFAAMVQGRTMLAIMPEGVCEVTYHTSDPVLDEPITIVDPSEAPEAWAIAAAAFGGKTPHLVAYNTHYGTDQGVIFAAG